VLCCFSLENKTNRFPLHCGFRKHGQKIWTAMPTVAEEKRKRKNAAQENQTLSRKSKEKDV